MANQCAFGGTPSPTATATIAPTTLPQPNYVFSLTVEVKLPATFANYYTTGSASSVDATTQLTLRITLATITGIGSIAGNLVSVIYSSCAPPGSAATVCSMSASDDGGDVVVYTVQLLANPLQGPSVGQALQLLTREQLGPVAVAVTASINALQRGDASLLDVSSVIISPQLNTLSTLCETGFSFGACAIPPPFSTSASPAPSLVPPAPASNAGAVAFGVIGILIVIGVGAATYMVHRASRMSKLAALAQAQATAASVMQFGPGAKGAAGRQRGAGVGAASFSFGGPGQPGSNPLARQMSSRRSVRTVKVDTTG